MDTRHVSYRTFESSTDSRRFYNAAVMLRARFTFLGTAPLYETPGPPHQWRALSHSKRCGICELLRCFIADSLQFSSFFLTALRALVWLCCLCSFFFLFPLRFYCAGSPYSNNLIVPETLELILEPASQPLQTPSKNRQHAAHDRPSRRLLQPRGWQSAPLDVRGTRLSRPGHGRSHDPGGR